MTDKIILDTNLSILLLVGLTNPSYIAKHKRLNEYDITDFNIIYDLLSHKTEVIFCPNILTETSNMLRQIFNPIKNELSVKFASLIRNATEIFVNSNIVVDHDEYIRLGLTDSAILCLADTDCTILTDDLDLYLAAASFGLKAINYSHIREMRPDFA